MAISEKLGCLIGMKPRLVEPRICGIGKPQLFNFAGKRVVVTGGSRGIGRGIAQGFVQSGAMVSICARNAEALEETRAELAKFGPAHAAVCDLSDGPAIADYISQAAAAMGGIDILVNNASGFGRADDESGWHTAFGVDMMALVRASHAAEPWLERAEPQGIIVNIGSTTSYRPSVKAPAYGAMKAAIKYHTATQAALLAKKNIRVNCVAPGLVATKIVTDLFNKTEQDAMASGQLFKRILQPEEIAATVVYLCSAEASMITGIMVPVDGGANAIF